MRRSTRKDGNAQTPKAEREPDIRVLRCTVREVEVSLRALQTIPWLPDDGYDELLSMIRKLRRAVR